MNETRTFTLAQLLTISTGILLTSIEDVYETLNFITGDNLFTHVLPRACKFAAPFLQSKFPFLISDGLKMDMEELQMRLKERAKDEPFTIINPWLRQIESTYGNCFEVESHADKWLSMNPVAELVSMVGKEKIITVTT